MFLDFRRGLCYASMTFKTESVKMVQILHAGYRIEDKNCQTG